MYVAPEISLTEHQRYWLKHIRACEASGKRITEYATDHGLGVRAMYEGKRVLVKKGVLPRTRATRFQRAQAVDPVMGSERCMCHSRPAVICRCSALERKSLHPERFV